MTGTVPIGSTPIFSSYAAALDTAGHGLKV
jgi:hypothetical protein